MWNLFLHIQYPINSSSVVTEENEWNYSTLLYVSSALRAGNLPDVKLSSVNLTEP